MRTPASFVKGDEVSFVTATGQRFDAEVILASENGRSLALGFDGLADSGRGGWLGRMPILLGEDGMWRDLAGALVEIERALP